MSDQREQQAPVDALTPGEWLRQERERQGRTVQQVAADLHIGAYMVEAIESNQFAVLGAPVFARGHLRKYATLLSLPVERAQSLYQSLSDRPQDQDPVPSMHRATEPSISMSPDSKQRRVLLRPAQWTFAVAAGALALAVLATWLLFSSEKPELHRAPASAAENKSESPLVAVTTTIPVAAASTAKPSAPPAERRQETQAPPQVAAAAAPVAGIRGKLRLRFSFNQESWVEVYDARGTRMLYEVGFPGETRGVDIDAPAQVVLGLASAVSTEANGRAIAVPARRVVNQVARFTVGADGAAQ